LVGLSENIFKIPEGIRAIPVRIRAIIDYLFPVVHMMEGPVGPSEGTSGPSRAGPAGPSRAGSPVGTPGPSTGVRTKADHDQAVRSLLESFGDPKSKNILHPDVLKRVKETVNALEQKATIRSLTTDEVLALTVFRRKYSEHAQGLVWLATKSLEEQERFNALRQNIWQKPDMIELRRKFLEVGGGFTQSVPAAVQPQTQPTNTMDLSNILNR
jgi:hypothetical protein